MIFAGSRYERVPTTLYVAPDGRQVRYLLLRQIPDPPPRELTIRTDGARLDQLAYRYLGDAQQWWRIADVNSASDPDELVDPGRRLVIPLVTR